MRFNLVLLCLILNEIAVEPSIIAKVLLATSRRILSAHFHGVILVLLRVSIATFFEQYDLLILFLMDVPLILTPILILSSF